MALHLADRGVGVLGTYHAHDDEAAAVQGEVEERGARAAMVRLDVMDVGSFGAFAEGVREELRETFGADRLHAVVHNGGFGVHAPFAETTEADFDRLVAVHYKGPYFLTQALLPLLADGGRVLFISTGLTRITSPGYSAYASAKGATEVVARYLAQELGERRVRVNALAPGATETDFRGGAVRDNAAVNAHLAGATALGRVGRPDDIGRAVAAVLSDDLDWVTGTRIEVSGGQNL